MKPKPLHRSLIFWFGLFVVVFILSAWVDSNFNGVNLRRHFHGTQYIVVHGQNRVLMTTAEGSLVSVVNEFRRSPTRAARTWGEVFPPFRSRALQSRNPTTDAIVSKGRLLNVPHWLLLLTVVLLWTGLLLWRSRHYRRAGQAMISAS